MPTTSEASTPSRSETRKAESTGTPVVIQLQLSFKLTLISYLRQPDQPGPISSRYNTLTMAWPQISRAAAALLSSALLVCAPLPGQQPAQAGTQGQSQEPAKVHPTPQSLKAFAPDPKRAQ